MKKIIENASNVRKVSEETKAVFKAEYGEDLHSLLLPLDDIADKQIEVLAKTPSRRDVSLAMKFMQSDPVRGQEILVKACLLTSKEEVLNNDGLFFAAAGLVSDLMPIRQGKFGKV